MGFDSKKIKQIKSLIIFVAIVTLFVLHSSTIGNAIVFTFSIFMPFIIGGGLAFVINMPLKIIENCILGKWKGKYATKFKRPLGIVLSLVFIIAIMAIVIGTVLPQLVVTVRDIVDIVPPFVDRTVMWMQKLFKDKPEILAYINEIDVESIDWAGMLANVTEFVKNQFGNVLSGTVGIISSIAGGVVDGVIALIFSLYILAQKEKLADQASRIIRAYFKEDKYNFLMKTGRLLNKNFHNFLTGQCLEAVILGTMFFVVMTIIKLPYAALTGVLIGFTALIPVAGAFIGCFVCAFLILMVSPVKALVFLIMFLVLQQIEGNLIYPRVVGNSVGLPAIWVLMAVTVGGSLMGIIGMLIFIPIFSTAYMLLRDDVNARNKKKRYTTNT